MLGSLSDIRHADGASGSRSLCDLFRVQGFAGARSREETISLPVFVTSTVMLSLRFAVVLVDAVGLRGWMCSIFLWAGGIRLRGLCTCVGWDISWTSSAGGGNANTVRLRSLSCMGAEPVAQPMGFPDA